MQVQWHQKFLNKKEQAAKQNALIKRKLHQMILAGNESSGQSVQYQTNCVNQDKEAATK